LKQFKSYADPGRNRAAGVINQEKLFELIKIRIDEKSWLSANSVSVGFYAINDIMNTKPATDFFSSECRWFPVNKIPKLGFDHDEMVRDALSTMRMQLYHFPIGMNLLSPKFTLKEIKLFYEVMSGKTLNATNFPNKLISLGLIVKLDEKKSIGAHRSPAYYKFDREIYRKSLKEGLVLV
jgi:hypothetical protein